VTSKQVRYLFMITVQKYPRGFVAAWFLCWVCILTFPLTLLALPLTFLISGSLLPGLTLIFVVGLLPLLSTILPAALVGPRVLRLPPVATLEAGAYGLIISCSSFLIWYILIEIFSRFTNPQYMVNSPGDVPGAAIAVGYLVVMPILVVTIMGAGFLAGILLHLSLNSHPSQDKRSQGSLT